MILPRIYENILTGKFEAFSVDPEIPHCYGLGDTAENALMSYKLLRKVMLK